MSGGRKTGASTIGENRYPSKRRRSKSTTTIHALDDDVLCKVFSLLDFFERARCSSVCKSWNTIINRLVKTLYLKQIGKPPEDCICLRKSLNNYLEDLAIEHHRWSLQDNRIDIDQWKAHSTRVTQCRMKMGSLLTGCGDKVVRLWSLKGYKCLEEYPVPDMASLVDFDFDETKIVGLLGTRICLWSRNGSSRSIFPTREGLFSNGLCMRYKDPEAVVGCEDGTVRVFDMYSKKCSQIIRMNAGPVKCISLTDDHLVLSGASSGTMTISSLSDGQQVHTLRSSNYADIRCMCFNPRSHLLFAGSTAGHVSCWDIWMMKNLWEKKVSPSVLYSMNHLRNDTSRLVVGGIDGMLRVLDQNSGELISTCIMDNAALKDEEEGFIEKSRGIRVSNNTGLGSRNNFPITCLAVGMRKVVTTHNSKYIRTWKFSKFCT